MTEKEPCPTPIEEHIEDNEEVVESAEDIL
jgi:hypothetical protein